VAQVAIKRDPDCAAIDLRAQQRRNDAGFAQAARLELHQPCRIGIVHRKYPIDVTLETPRKIAHDADRGCKPDTRLIAQPACRYLVP
jgi:hypothetical protein